ncbi:MAG: tRNA uridine(34) 5-carboxymethylaminomethyl modification radical SAM/GNAT enzyme Elp3 [Candidatus Bathyarchaeota archaeon]|nr:MAG: tRNA uridine(34) 5-carboxymethylaminomethyl modification radical SAM/GNAT enzyme Elp3 [Candidatus Bathyarchaeota archaeon]
MVAALRAIVEKLLSLPSPSRSDVDRVKFEVSREYGLGGIPGNAEIICALSPDEVERLLPLLRRKEARARSGVNVVAVMTEPLACPHGRCAYCPGGPGEGVPQSYTGHEPASMRGAQNEYDPYRQVTSRIKQLRVIGHEVDKVDLIIMGGTFPASPPEYQEGFVKGCLDALAGVHTSSLAEAKRLAETASLRNVGMTVETRPDCLDTGEVDWLLGLGVTRVELGVQNVYDDIYELVERGHTVQDVVEATRLLKDSGLKVCYHMMPGLPGSSPERDLEGFKTIFEDSRFRPDMLKIYPTLVVKGTKLYDGWREGSYNPLSTDAAVELVARMKELVPPWVRIMRVQRDIPTPIIEAGVDKSNLRQLAQEEMERRGNRCRCIRCREVGHREDAELEPDRLEIDRRTYEASDGLEEFISVEDEAEEVLVGFLRLRIPSEKAHRPEIDPGSAIVRELHVYGRMVPVGAWLSDGWQHRGWGEALLAEAERIASECHGSMKLLVMSALGTKEYYRRLGYRKDGAYMSKGLN